MANATDKTAPPLRLGVVLALVASVQILAISIGFATRIDENALAVIWPANGTMIAALILSPRRIWGVLLMSAAILELTWSFLDGGFALAPSAVVAAGCNGAECLAVAWLCRDFELRGSIGFSVFSLARLMILICLVAAIVAVPGSAVLYSPEGNLSWSSLWQMWFLGDTVGALIAAPALLIWFQTRDDSVTHRLAWESCAFLSCLTLLATLLIFLSKGTANGSLASPYLVLPFFLWAGLRLPLRNVAAGQLLLAAVFLMATSMRVGPFAAESRLDVVGLQTFLFVITVSSLLLSAISWDRSREHRALEEARARLELALAGAGAAHWEFDMQTRQITYSLSKVMRTILPSELLSLSYEGFLQLVHPEDRPGIESFFQSIARVRSEAPQSTEFRVGEPGAAYHWIQARARLVPDHRGRLTTLSGIYLDVTDRKLLDERLRDRLRFQELISQFGRRFLSSSPGEFDELLRKSIDEIAKHFNADYAGVLVFGDDEQRAAFSYESDRKERAPRPLHPLLQLRAGTSIAALQGIASLTLANEIVAFDSLESFPIAATADRDAYSERGVAALLQLPLRAGDEPFGAIYLESVAPRHWDFDAIDRLGLMANLLAAVLERQRAEHELEFRANFERELSHISNRLVNCPPDQIDGEMEMALAKVGERFQVDRCFYAELYDGQQKARLRLEWHSPGIEPVSEYLQDVPNQLFAAIIGPLQAGQILYSHRADQDPNFPEEFRELLTRFGGKSVVHVPVIVQGELAGTIGLTSIREYRHWSSDRLTLLRFVGDMVVGALQRKRVAMALEEKRDQLTAATRLAIMGEMVAGIAHEIRQPLHAIRNFAAAGFHALDNSPTPDLLELRRWNHRITELVDRSSEIIRRYRDFCRPQKSNYVRLQLGEVVSEAFALVQTELRSNHVQVTNSVSPSLTPIVGDRIQLEQVFVNLFTNACEAMVGEPTEERRIEISANEVVNGDRLLHITVRDFGHGLEPTATERVFDPFWTTKEHGTGLGLAVCRTILAEHGGRIWIQTADRGVTVHIELPMREEAA